MRHRQTIIEHGPRRLWWAPWRQICRCGVAAYPCPTLKMQAQLRKPRPGWNAPTSVLWTGTSGLAHRRPVNERPLMTPGQIARSSRGFRR